MANGWSRYPVHDYGTGSIRQGLSNFRKTKAAKEQAFLQILKEQSAEGLLQNYQPGAPTYEKTRGAFGKDIADAFGEKNRLVENRRVAEKKSNSFDMATKQLSALASFDKLLGKKAFTTDVFKNIAQSASKSFKEAGINFNYNNLLTHKENLAVLNERSLSNLNNLTKDIEKPTFENLNEFEVALTKYTQIPGYDKDIYESMKLMFEDKRKELVAKTKAKETTTENKRKEAAERTEWDRKQKSIRMNKPATLAGMTAYVVQSLRDGVPIDEMSKTDQLIAKRWQEKGSKDDSWREQVFADWQKIPGNEKKSKFDFDREHPSRVVSTEKKEELPRKKFEDKIYNQAGGMREEAQKVVNNKVKQNMKLKEGIASGKISQGMLVAKEMQPWVKEKYPNAVFGESDGKYYWAVQDAAGGFKIVADENGWVK